jgi:hypothetical protein
VAASGSKTKISSNVTTCLLAILLPNKNETYKFKSRPGYFCKSLKTLMFSGFRFLKIWEVAA